MAFGIEEFKVSQRGQIIARMFDDPNNVTDMIAVSRHGIPPVQDVGDKLTELNIHLTDEEKRLLGRWVREIMEKKGWTTDGVSKKRVSPSGQFKTGAVYYRKGESSKNF